MLTWAGVGFSYQGAASVVVAHPRFGINFLPIIHVTNLTSNTISCNCNFFRFYFLPTGWVSGRAARAAFIMASAEPTTMAETPTAFVQRPIFNTICLNFKSVIDSLQFTDNFKCAYFKIHNNQIWIFVSEQHL